MEKVPAPLFQPHFELVLLLFPVFILHLLVVLLVHLPGKCSLKYLMAAWL